MSQNGIFTIIRRIIICLSAGVVLLSMLACNFFPADQISSLMRDLADKIEPKDSPVQAEGKAQEESSSSHTLTEQIGNSSTEGKCSEYEGMVVYRKTSKVGKSDVTQLIITDDKGNTVFTIPGENDLLRHFDDPAWSPNHCRIVFSAQTKMESNKNLYTMDPDGTDIVQLTDATSFEHHADWSPDGSKIVYVVGTVVESQAQGGVEGTSQEQSSAVVSGQASVPQPQSGTASSNQGNTGSAFQTGKQTAHIWMMNADGADQHLLTDVNDSLDDPEWSPDGRQVVFTCKNPGQPPEANMGAICVVDADGKNIQQLSPSDNWSYNYPTWSPDGKQIAFTTNAFGQAAMGIMNADGSELKKVSMKNVAEHSSASQFKKWSSDGKRIIYHDVTTTNINGKMITGHIFILDLESNTVSPLTDAESAVVIERFPDW